MEEIFGAVIPFPSPNEREKTTSYVETTSQKYENPITTRQTIETATLTTQTSAESTTEARN